MKKYFMAIIASTIIFTTNVIGCPLWECQYPIDDYNCGCNNASYQGNCYNEYSQAQPIYCQYCGHETWDCVCDRNYDQNCSGYYEENYAESAENYYNNYSCSSISYDAYMQHWANIRDCAGNIIGQADCGDYVGVIGEDSDTGRVIIYHYNTGIQGSVLAECVYGGYQWDGTGDNGVYNSYQGGDSCSGGWDEVVDCSYSEPSCSVSGTGYGYSCASYTELISIFRQYITCGLQGLGGCR